MPNSEEEAQRNNARRVDTRRKIQLGGFASKQGSPVCPRRNPRRALTAPFASPTARS